MLASMRKKALVAAGVAALSLTVAATASAAPATWSTTGQVKQAGNLTFKLNGGSAKTCAINVTGTAVNSGGSGLWYSSPISSAACVGGGSLVWNGSIFQTPGSDGAGNYSVSLTGPRVTGPWAGTWRHTAASLPFVNGNISTPSQIVLNDTQIGYQEGTSLPVTATGTLNVTTPAGGLVTLN